MGQFRTTADIADEVLQKSGEVTNGNSDYEALVLKYLNKAHQAIIGGGNIYSIEVDESWPWARSRHPMILELEPCIVTGSVTVTAGDINVSFDNPPAQSVQGWFFQLNQDGNNSTVYRITAHEAGSDAAVLDSSMLDETGSYSFRLYKLEYELIPAYMYVDRTNDKIDFIQSGTTVLTATLTHGSYTPSTLLAHVVAQLNAAGATSVYSGSYDSVTRKFSLISSLAGGKIFSLLGATGTNRLRSSLPLLGFDRLDVTGAGTYTSVYVTNGISRLVEPFKVFSSEYSELEICSTDVGTMDDEVPIGYATERVPRRFAKVHHANDGTIVVRFDSYPRYKTKVLIPWVPVPIDLQDNDASIPLIPRNEIDVLIHAATTFVLFDKEDDKWEKTLSVTKAQLEAMQKKLRSELRRTGDNFAQIIPRADLYPGNKRRFRYGYTANPGSGAASSTGNTTSTKTLTYLDFQTAGLTKSVVARTLPSNRMLMALVIKHSQAFAGGSISSLLLDVGTDSDPTQFVNGFDVMQAVGPGVQDSVVLLFYPSISTQIKVRATAVGANLSALTQGSVDVMLTESVIV